MQAGPRDAGSADRRGRQTVGGYSTSKVITLFSLDLLHKGKGKECGNQLPRLSYTYSFIGSIFFSRELQFRRFELKELTANCEQFALFDLKL
jgi:hypothetical protein